MEGSGTGRTIRGCVVSLRASRVEEAGLFAGCVCVLIVSLSFVRPMQGRSRRARRTPRALDHIRRIARALTGGSGVVGAQLLMHDGDCLFVPPKGRDQST